MISNNTSKQLSVEQYAKSIYSPDKVKSRQGILYRINNNIDLPNVSKIEKVGKAYVITLLS